MTPYCHPSILLTLLYCDPSYYPLIVLTITTLKLLSLRADLIYCSGEISRVGTNKSADPLSSRDRNLGQKPYKNPFLDRFQKTTHRGSLLVSNIVLFLHKLSLIVLFLGPI